MQDAGLLTGMMSVGCHVGKPLAAAWLRVCIAGMGTGELPLQGCTCSHVDRLQPYILPMTTPSPKPCPHMGCFMPWP
jgi:hypothetical protein